MIAELGHFALVLAFLLALVQSTLPLVGAARNDARLMGLARPPADGEGLNPILQDPGLAMHPPMLYLGYVGFSMAFSFAVAALIDGKVDAAWARWVRPWTLAAWIALTLGIGLGSHWAYYTLGWGGWWYWDPVENASLMPWLLGTALLHSAIVVEKRDALKSWTILLAWKRADLLGALQRLWAALVGAAAVLAVGWWIAGGPLTALLG